METESKILGVSTRGWLVLIITACVCGMSLCGIEIKEPLYSGFLLGLGFYFGQKNQKGA